MLEAQGIARHASAGVVGDIEILGASVGLSFGKSGMSDGAAVRIGFSELGIGFDRASELEPVALSFGPCAGGGHFESCVAEGTAMRSEGLRLLCVAGIDGDEGAALHLIDDEVVDVALIVSGVGDEEGASFELVEALEFLDKRFGHLRIGVVVGESGFDEGDAFGRDDDVGAVAPKALDGF